MRETIEDMAPHFFVSSRRCLYINQRVYGIRLECLAVTEGC